MPVHLQKKRCARAPGRAGQHRAPVSTTAGSRPPKSAFPHSASVVHAHIVCYRSGDVRGERSCHSVPCDLRSMLGSHSRGILRVSRIHSDSLSHRQQWRRHSNGLSDSRVRSSGSPDSHHSSSSPFIVRRRCPLPHPAICRRLAVSAARVCQAPLRLSGACAVEDTHAHCLCVWQCIRPG